MQRARGGNPAGGSGRRCRQAWTSAKHRAFLGGASGRRAAVAETWSRRHAFRRAAGCRKQDDLHPKCLQCRPSGGLPCHGLCSAACLAHPRLAEHQNDPLPGWPNASHRVRPIRRRKTGLAARFAPWPYCRESWALWSNRRQATTPHPVIRRRKCRGGRRFLGRSPAPKAESARRHPSNLAAPIPYRCGRRRAARGAQLPCGDRRRQPRPYDQARPGRIRAASDDKRDCNPPQRGPVCLRVRRRGCQAVRERGPRNLRRDSLPAPAHTAFAPRAYRRVSCAPRQAHRRHAVPRGTRHLLQ